MTVEQLNVIVSANKADFDKKINEINKQLDTMNNNAASASSGMLGSFKALASGLAALGIGKFLSDCNSAYTVQMENELKLETIMKQRLKASDEEIQSIKDLASAQQALGVVGDEVQLAGAQQLATFASQKSTLETLIPAMNNLLVQQNGLNASTSDATSIANMMGKVLQGETSALKRVGISFTEAEENALKYGNEEERAATLAKVITNNVGEMNEALRGTVQGEMTALANTWGDVKEEIGAAFQPFLQSVLPMLTEGLNAVSPVIVELTSNVSDFGVWLANLNGPSKTFLTLMVGSAVAIPAVTAAQKLLNIAKLAYSGVLSILIPKQLTFASALKATMGWLSLIAGALFLFSSMSDSSKNAVGAADGAIGDTGETADKTAESVGNLGESMEELGESAKSLAGFDEINKLGGSSSTIASSIASKEDIAVLSDANGEIAAIKEQVGQLDGLGVELGTEFSLDGLYDGVMQAWEWLTTDGYALLTGAVNEIFSTGEDFLTVLFGNDDERYEALLRLNEKVKALFGEDFVNFWKGVGADISTVFTGTEKDSYEALLRLNENIRNLFGDDWTNFWKTVGSSINSFISNDIAGGLRKVDEALKGISDFILLDLGKPFRELAEVIEKNNKEPEWLSRGGSTLNNYVNGANGLNNFKMYASGGFPDYGDIFIANERGPEMVGTIGGRTAVVNNSQIETAIENAIARGFAKAGNGQPVEIHVYTELDGEIIGESVTEYQSNRTRRDNGYKK